MDMSDYPDNPITVNRIMANTTDGSLYCVGLIAAAA